MPARRRLNRRKRKRSCGECTECCTALSVTEIHKPAMEPCVHQDGKGCDIYPERPQSCRHFRCGWLDGEGPPDMRPDRLGVVIWLGDTMMGQTVYMQETREGAFPLQADGDDPLGELIAKSRHYYPVLLLFKNGTRRILPVLGKGLTWQPSE